MTDDKGDTPIPEEDKQAAAGMPPDLPPPTPEEIVTPDVVEKIIKEYNKDCELVDFSATLGTKMGDNYMSIIYAVEINIKNRKSGETETIRVMLKTMPRNPMRQQMINDSGAFVKEAKMYGEVIPKMISFQKDKGLKDDELFLGWPQCFITFNDGTSDYLGMEDLRVKRYKMANRLDGLDVEHTQLALTNLARYHAISFAMFGGDYDKIMESYPWLEEKMFIAEDKVQEPMKVWMKSMYSNEADIIRKEGFIKEADWMENIYNEKFWATMNNLVGSKVKNAIISHGDFWTNNMLFSYDDGDTPKPKLVKFVDFQLARCSTRSIDLGYFLHSSVPIDNFNTKEEQFLKLYYDEFIRFLKRLDVDPSEFELTWEGLLEEYKNSKFYGVLTGFMLAPILSADAEDIPDMELMKESDFEKPDAAKDFMTALMGTKSDSTKKIINLAVNHLPRCPQMNIYIN